MVPDFNIPIINYHKVSLTTDVGITSRRPEHFKQDMQALKAAGYQTITFKNLVQKHSLPAKPIIITFDDGYKSVLEFAFPIMEEFGFSGIIYMPTDFLGRTNDWDVQFGGRRFEHLSKKDLIFLHKKGFEIGSHGCSHRSFLTLGKKQTQRELNESKTILEDLLNDRVVSISYPFGRFNAWLLQQSKKAGYVFGVAAIYLSKFKAMNGLSPLALRRFNVYRMDSTGMVLSKAENNFKTLLSYRDWLIQKGSLATVVWQKFFNRF